MKNEIVIDALPYIDKGTLLQIGKQTIDELINKELNQIDKKKIDEEIDARYPIHKRQINYETINQEIKALKDSFDVPPMNKYYNEEEWKKLFKELNYTIEVKQIENLNLELINVYSSSTWESYINKSMNYLTQLKHERETLHNDILFINKKRKYDQTVYQTKLEGLDKKIKSTLSNISSIEVELINK